MNRASIGVQDFDEEIQQTIGRIQSYDITRDAVARDPRARHQKPERRYPVRPAGPVARRASPKACRSLLSLNPDRVALYGYAHVPWMAKRQQMIPSDALPTPEERLELFETARRLFLWDGYTEIGIDHFATPDRWADRARRRPANCGAISKAIPMTPADVLIGLGASSISHFPQGYAQNAPATARIPAASASGRFSGRKGHVFTGEDQLRARMIEAADVRFPHRRRRDCRRSSASRPPRVQRMFDKAKAEFPTTC